MQHHEPAPASSSLNRQTVTFEPIRDFSRANRLAPAIVYVDTPRRRFKGGVEQALVRYGLSAREICALLLRAGAPLVLGSGFCYYVLTHGLRLSKPLLLLPVEHLRRVSPLVSDLLSTIDPDDAPVAECRVCLCAHRFSAFPLTPRGLECPSPKLNKLKHRRKCRLPQRRG